MPRSVGLFELPQFSTYRKPDFGRYFASCAIVLVTALVVLCLCKVCGSSLMPARNNDRDDDCGVCTSAKAARTGGSPGEVEHIKDAAHLEDTLHSDGCVVMYMAPWCAHCQTFKPEFAEAASEDTETRYVMCDCENAVGPEVLKAHGIEAFPTVRYCAHGQTVDEFQGPRTKDDLMAWAKSKKTK